MKKSNMLFLLLISALLIISVSACGSTNTGGDTSTAKTETKTEEKKDEAPATEAKTEEPAAEAAPADSGDGVEVNEAGEVQNPEAVKVGENELAFWTLFGGGDGEFMQQMVDSYNATSPTMTVKNVKLEWGQYYTKLMTAVAAGKGPDIGVSHTSKLPELVDQGAVIPFDDYAAAAGVAWDDYTANVLAATQIEGTHYAIPIDTHAEILYYNKKILRDAGLLTDDKLTIDGSFFEWLEASKAKLPEGVAPLSFSTTGDDPWRLWWATYYQMGGSPIISEDGSSLTMDMNTAVEAVNYVKGIYDKELTPKNLEDFYKHFQSGMGATFISGVWCTGILEGTDGFEFGAMAVPAAPGTSKKAAWGDSHTLVLPYKKDIKQDRAENAVKFMKYIGDQGATWTLAGHIPASDKVVQSDAFKKLPYRSDYADVASSVVFTTNSKVNWPAKDAMIRNLNLVWTGDATPEQAMQDIADEINLLLQ